MPLLVVAQGSYRAPLGELGVNTTPFLHSSESAPIPNGLAATLPPCCPAPSPRRHPPAHPPTIPPSHHPATPLSHLSSVVVVPLAPLIATHGTAYMFPAVMLAAGIQMACAVFKVRK